MLGFILNSKDMIVRPTQDKKDSTVALCSTLLQRKTHSIRKVAQVIGKIVACFPGVLFGPLFYRHIDHDKTMALKETEGNFDKEMILSFDAKTEINWWIENLSRASKPLTRNHASMEIKTDASLQGWGASYKNSSTGGLWSFDEQQNHINLLEMYAIFLALKTYANDLTDVHIKILSDSATAVLVLTHMGTSRSIACNNLCKQIWLWCIERNIWLTIAHIPGKQNIEADRESRRSANTSAEWQLNPKILHSCLTDIGFSPSVDIFASRLNKQFDKFVSFKPEPEAFAIDAFTLDWSSYKFYAFPPFSMITRMLKKIQIEKAEGVCVIPNWPTQPWYPTATNLMQSKPILLKPSRRLLQLPSSPSEVHPLCHNLHLWFVSYQPKN